MVNSFVYPLGSVVLAQAPDNKEVKVLISAYGIKDKNGNRYKYAGFEIPVGYNPDRIMFLNDDNVICPLFIGYIGDENKKTRREVSKHYDKYVFPLLPIGSIVEIADGKMVMITGLCSIDLISDKLFDYVAEDLNNRLVYNFSRDEIVDIIFVGFSDQKFLAYRSFLEDFYKEQGNKESIYKAIRDYILEDGE